MLIDELTLKKFCIKQGFLDPHLLWNAFSDYTKKRASKMLGEIKEKYSRHPERMEFETVKLIQEHAELGSRQRRFTFLLLMMAQEDRMISASTYRKLREEMGIKEYSQDTEKVLNTEKEEERNIFDLLQGTSQSPAIAEDKSVIKQSNQNRGEYK